MLARKFSPQEVTRGIRSFLVWKTGRLPKVVIREEAQSHVVKVTLPGFTDEQLKDDVRHLLPEGYYLDEKAVV
jgi:hypothetical protein